MLWRDDREVDCGGLENRYTCLRIVGSNPTLSAINYEYEMYKLQNLFLMILLVILNSCKKSLDKKFLKDLIEIKHRNNSLFTSEKLAEKVIREIT